MMARISRLAQFMSQKTEGKFMSQKTEGKVLEGF